MIGINDTYTYCRCRGNHCNIKEDASIKCYSTPSVDETTLSLYNFSQLRNQNFFTDENLIFCPTAQCYRYGELKHAKGQLISKWFLGSSISPKKQTSKFNFTNEQIQLYYYDTSGRLVFVRFLEKSTTPNNHFEIN